MVIALLPMMSLAVGAAPSDNPFVGSWESFDHIERDGFVDNSRVRLHISDSGQFQLRDEAAIGCRNLGFGFVPATVQGSGEFDGFEFIGSGDLYCYPSDEEDRVFAAGPLTLVFEYDESSDTLFDGVECWWRTGVSDSSACPAP
jgi:hypothetical protein